MIRINLVKKSTHKEPIGIRFSFPRWLIIAVVIVTIALLGGIGGKYLLQKISSAKTPHPVVQTQPSSFTPSTYKKTDIVEDVVREVARERASEGRGQQLDLHYNDLSFLEKVNYEVLFGKNIFSMLSRAVPLGIGLKTLEVDNFQTVYAVGLGTSRELVSSTFIALKSEQLELLPQPYSYITSNNGDGYRFVVTCKATFGLDLTDPFQANDYLPTRDDLPMLRTKIIRMGKETGVFFSGKPTKISAEKIGAYRRFHYRFHGTTTYNDFVKFLLKLHTNKVPCAFKKVDLKAQSGSKVAIETQVIFTVRE